MLKRPINWDSKMVVAVDRWVAIRSGRRYSENKNKFR